MQDARPAAVLAELLQPVDDAAGEVADREAGRHREDGKRRAVVTTNVRGRDLGFGAFDVRGIRRRVDRQHDDAAAAR